MDILTRDLLCSWGLQEYIVLQLRASCCYSSDNDIIGKSKLFAIPTSLAQVRRESMLRA